MASLFREWVINFYFIVDESARITEREEAWSLRNECFDINSSDEDVLNGERIICGMVRRTRSACEQFTTR
jgi:hypothetical protein